MNVSNCDGSAPLSTERPRALRIDRAMMMHANEERDDDATADVADGDVEVDKDVDGSVDRLDSKMASADRTLTIAFRPMSISEKRCTQNRHTAQNSSKTCRDCGLPPSSVRILELVFAEAASKEQFERCKCDADREAEAAAPHAASQYISIPPPPSSLSSLFSS